MILMDFKIINSNRINYIISEKNKIIGLSIDENGIQPFQYDLFDRLINNIKFNNKCIKISKYNDYDVYFNPLTKYKHYIKDGKEDYLMFYLKNGEDALLYKNKGEIKEKVKRFICSSVIVFNICASCFLLINTGIHVIDSKNNDTQITYFNDEIINSKDVTVEELISLINESNNISDNDKRIMMNKELFEDILPYYNNSDMKNIIRIRFKDITIVYEKLEDARGSYNHLEPNIIRLDEALKEQILNDDTIIDEQESVTGHEFIHMLQNNFYIYLKESSAELMSHEYFGSKIDSYAKGVTNLRLLIEIIGPEPILKGLFQGEYIHFNKILFFNLEKNDYNELIKYLNCSPEKISDSEDKRIKEILCNLYKNMYGNDIREDKNIMYELLYSGKYDNEIEHNGKIYLKKSSKNIEEKCIIRCFGIKDDLVEMGYLDKINKRYSINENNFILYNDEGTVQLLCIPINEALELGYISPCSIDENVFGYKCNMFNYELMSEYENASYDGINIEFNIPSINQRFNINNYNQESNRKVNM